MTSLYDPERISKISQIMPSLAGMARKGDEIIMGLDGDPKLNLKEKRATGTIQEIVAHDDGEYLITVKDSDTGKLNTYSSFSIKPNEIWEFTPRTLNAVMDRERKAREERDRAEASAAKLATKTKSDETYRGIFSSSKDAEIDKLRAEVDELKTLLTAQKKQEELFHNHLITTMHEMAGDICRLDRSGSDAEFCKVFNSEYARMMASRSEAPVREDATFRGMSKPTSEEDASPSEPAYQGGKKTDIMFSDEESLLSDSDSDA